MNRSVDRSDACPSCAVRSDLVSVLTFPRVCVAPLCSAFHVDSSRPKCYPVLTSLFARAKHRRFAKFRVSDHSQTVTALGVSESNWFFRTFVGTRVISPLRRDGGRRRTREEEGQGRGWRRGGRGRGYCGSEAMRRPGRTRQPRHRPERARADPRWRDAREEQAHGARDREARGDRGGERPTDRR